jgi:UDP:flavonoid glycosyltransferase YjiC (YdhE family)
MFVDGGAGEDFRELLSDWRADLAIIDCLMLGPLQAAQAIGVPTVAVIHSLWAFFGEMFPQGPIGEMGAAHGRHPVELWEKATEVWVTTERTLDPVQGEVPPNVHWTGVAQPPAKAIEDRSRDTVLLSLSTVYFPGQQESMQRILDAVGHLPINVVATIDENIATDRLRIPANVDARSFVDHGEVMPRVGMVIGHGGHATTMYALAHALPLLIIPQHPMLDQPLLGQLIAAAGAGIALDQHPDAADIHRAVMTLMNDDTAARAAAELGACIRARNGTLEAAGRVETLIEENVLAH